MPVTIWQPQRKGQKTLREISTDIVKLITSNHLLLGFVLREKKKLLLKTLKSCTLLSSADNIPIGYAASGQSFCVIQVGDKAFLYSIIEIKNGDS